MQNPRRRLLAIQNLTTAPNIAQQHALNVHCSIYLVRYLHDSTSQLLQSLDHVSLDLRDHTKELDLLILARELDPGAGDDLSGVALAAALALLRHALGALDAAIGLERNAQALDLDGAAALVAHAHGLVRAVDVEHHVAAPELRREVDHAHHRPALFLLPQPQRLHRAHLLLEFDHFTHSLVHPQRLLGFVRRHQRFAEQLVLECVGVRE